MHPSIKRQAVRKIPPIVTAAVIGSMSLMGAVLIWSIEPSRPNDFNSNPATPANLADYDDVVGLSAIEVKKPEGDHQTAQSLHSIIHGEEDGVRVVRIKLTEGGDEVVVDADTGMFIKKRSADSLNYKPMPMPGMPGGEAIPMGTKSSMG